MFRFADVPLSLSGTTRITGQRTYLRAPTMEDWAEWAELRARSRAFLTPWEPTWPDDSLARDHYRRRLRQQVREWRAGEAYGLFIFLNDRRRLVGGINLSNVRRGVAQTASVGYWMGQPFAGQGLMTDALRAILPFVFDELRLDPYYRFTAARFPEFAPHLDRLIADCRNRAVSLVHGDWSPKNLLVHDGDVTAIDFEVVHFGNPAFDTGFLINHLLLKSIHRPELAGGYERCAAEFWRAYDPKEYWLWDSTMAQLGGLMLARVAGKSPAEYLTGPQKATAWRVAAAIIRNPPGSVREVWQCLF